MDNGKLLRVTFSESLAYHMVSQTNRGCVKKVRFVTGRKLEPGEKSKSGLYGIAKKNGWVLRITMFPDAVEMWKHPSRDIVEIWLV